MRGNADVHALGWQRIEAGMNPLWRGTRLWDKRAGMPANHATTCQRARFRATRRTTCISNELLPRKDWPWQPRPRVRPH